jgi:hypothetical protein
VYPVTRHVDVGTPLPTTRALLPGSDSPCSRRVILRIDAVHSGHRFPGSTALKLGRLLMGCLAGAAPLQRYAPCRVPACSRILATFGCNGRSRPGRHALLKSLVLLVGALLFSLSLAACGGGGEGTPRPGETPGAGPPGGTVTIDLWHSETAANSDTLDRLISRFNSSQSEVRVRSSYQGNRGRR